MNETEKSSSAEISVQSDALRNEQSLAGKKKSGGSLLWPVLVGVLIAALCAGAWFVRMHMIIGATAQPSSTAVIVQMEQRITNIEQKIQTLDSRLNDLGARVDKNSAVSVSTELPAEQQAPAPVAPPAATTQAMAHMQSDLVALSASMAALQAEVKQTGSATAQTQQTTQNTLAAAIAFVQLRETADAGRGYASELNALRTVAGSNKDIQESLTRLESHAAKGAPTVAVLRDGFMELESAANVAVDKAAAQNWWQRLLAELENLISIRPLHGGTAPDVFGTAETALGEGDLSAVLEAIKHLPPTAQEIFKEWRSKAEARKEVDTALRAMADHFIAETSPSSVAAPVPAAPEKDEP